MLLLLPDKIKQLFIKPLVAALHHVTLHDIAFSLSIDK